MKMEYLRELKMTVFPRIRQHDLHTSPLGVLDDLRERLFFQVFVHLGPGTQSPHGCVPLYL